MLQSVTTHQKIWRRSNWGWCYGWTVIQSVPVVGDYRTRHCFKIGFYQTTFLAKADDFPSEVPEKSFVDYNDILGGKLDKTYLVGESISMPFIMH